ncbi:hypothetical protein BJY01DRAFT_222260 [Aspergillus pseudoustus]|uniref:MutL C-terminal dimerisation domain-containing protein n=1 Tax=Aspergillus pseudoustus TaxID=1810923 RepID=A0ABR4J8E3_9EURO
MNAHKIQPLPSEVVAKIKSSTSITHLNEVIAELVKNALDANAQSIFVTVDYRRGGCVVEDDGDGILPAEFAPDGGLGKIHHTSKLLSESPVHGQRGSFLASLSALALLTITSHHLHDASTNTVIFHHSTPVARLMPAPRHHGLRFSDHGTRVTVNDLFGNMPVRVKSRALTLQKPDELDRQWDELKQLMTSLLLSHDTVLKLVISDVDKERKLTNRPHGQGARANGDLDLARFSSILSQAGFVDTHNPKVWHAVSAVAPGLSIRAALSLVPSPSKKVQFISMGIDPVFARNHTNVLYSEVNRLFAMSDFRTVGTNEATDLDARRGRSMQINKWPMFYIRINAGPIATDQDSPESDKSLQRILDVVSLMVNEFLKEHNMRPRGGKRKRQDSVQGTESPDPRPGQRAGVISELPAKQIRFPSFSRLSVSSHFGSWSRVKSGNSRANGASIPKTQGVSAQPGIENINTLNTQTITNVTSDSRSKRAHGSADPSGQTEEPRPDAIVPWVDPYTGISHWVNSRTGQSVHVRPSAGSALTSRPRTTGCLMAPRLDNTKRSASAVPQGQNTWLENLLGDWKNPVFGRAEKPINALHIETDDSSHRLCGLENLGVSKYRGKLRKRDLATARVIGQVDQKFILVNIAVWPSPPTLVLIDQHAADERCRVEALFEEFFDPNGIQTVQIDPVTFDIGSTEAALFRKQKEFFRFWGVEYTVGQGTRNTKASVVVSHLPTMIAERCRTEPGLIVSIIRSEIWKRTESGSARPPSPAVGRTGHKDWVGRLAGCPSGILDLLNSRACRTAIMFNDDLTVDECENLVRRLATCVLPFQCAHGRPSMVPLVDLQGADHVDDVGNEGVGFVEAFKRWQSR